MIEKINQPMYKAISNPCKEVLMALDMLKENRGDRITIAEIGVGIGATSVKVAEKLSKEDLYYLFSYEDDVTELRNDLVELPKCEASIYAIGNTTKTYDSYAWSLAKIYQELSNKELFDLVYLDGAHTFCHDGLTCCILKRMMKMGGMIIFDDIDWCHAKSPTLNPTVNTRTSDNFTDEQIETCQVAMVVNIFMEEDKDWEIVPELSSVRRVTYKKVR